MKFRRCGRILLAVLAAPLLVITDAQRESGTQSRDKSGRRFDAVVGALQWLLRIYIVVCLVIWFWQPRPRWVGNGFGPMLDPIFAVQDGIAVAVIGALGIFFVAVALVAFGLVAHLLVRGRRATAEVVSDAAPTEFRFTDRDGQTRVVSGPLASSHSRFQAGQRVRLVYLPRQPETFILDRFRDKWGVPLVMLLLGLAVLFPCVAFVTMKS